MNLSHRQTNTHTGTHTLAHTGTLTPTYTVARLIKAQGLNALWHYCPLNEACCLSYYLWLITQTHTGTLAYTPTHTLTHTRTSPGERKILLKVMN